MEETEIQDWRDALAAGEIDRRIMFLADAANAAKTNTKGWNDAKKRLERFRKIHLNLHKVIDPEKIKRTRDRILSGQATTFNSTEIRR